MELPRRKPDDIYLPDGEFTRAMASPAADNRSSDRQARDEHIAAQPVRPPLELPPDVVPEPVEAILARG